MSLATMTSLYKQEKEWLKEVAISNSYTGGVYRT